MIESAATAANPPVQRATPFSSSPTSQLVGLPAGPGLVVYLRTRYIVSAITCLGLLNIAEAQATNVKAPATSHVVTCGASTSTPRLHAINDTMPAPAMATRQSVGSTSGRGTNIASSN